MPVRITIDAFSGRPNPTVLLGGDDAADMLARVTPAKRVRDAVAVPEAILGYRGIHFQLVDEKVRGLPQEFRLADGLLTGPKLSHAPTDPTVEDFIVDPKGPFQRTQIQAELLEGIREQLHRVVATDWKKWYREIRWPVRPTCPCAPLYEPDWWNDPSRQPHNNCYNYGTNYRTDTFAQPGRAAGAQYASIACNHVTPAAVLDGLIDNPTANNKCPKEGHLVALVSAPPPGFTDYHWYRKGRNGRWSHKPGGGQATNKDNSGAIITDPRTADRGDYTDFCTFMTVMHGHTKIH
jgi:hypothetical protein